MKQAPLLAYSIALVAGLALSPGPVLALAPGMDSPDPLVAIDRNRQSIVSDIVQGFQGEVAKASPGNESQAIAALRDRLSLLRADRLLAASLASSYASLAAILEESGAPRETAFAGARQKVLGDANRDLVYTPLTPCRLIDTRGFGAPIQGGAFAPETRRSYIPNGLCGLPVTGVATILVAFTTQNLTPGSGGYLSILAPGAPIATSADIFNLGTEWSASNTAVATEPAAQFDVFVTRANAHVIIDVLGYFSAALGGVKTITTGTGLTGGPITSSGTISIAASGVGTTQIANGAVTNAKIAVGALPQTAFAITAATSATIGASSIGFVASPACPASTTALSGFCRSSSRLVRLYETFANSGSGWTCGYDNSAAVTATISATAVCMELPAATK